ncbi:hypothetical protein KSD_01390 [Ktedonobacter sp. SOSP1-85]|nr:hypothetical protein KSD_01390 [Ktedonobacter sp. SOSP1-85]
MRCKRYVRRANWSAVNPCGGDSHKKEAIETSITATDSAVAQIKISVESGCFHSCILSEKDEKDSLFSDMIA